MNSEKDIVIEIDGFKIKTNSIYKLKDKPDATAPSGLKELQVTKIPSAEVEEIIPGCRFKGTNPNDPTKGIWDTGFYTDSPCYATRDKEVVAALVEKLQSFIVVPYVEIYGGTNDLSPTDDGFWLNKSIRIRTGRVFNTQNPEELLELYLLLQYNAVTPEGQEGNPKYKHSSYIIVDNEANTDVKKTKANDEFTSIGNFTRLLTGNKEKLINILHYLDVTVSSKIEDTTLMYTFQEHLKSDFQNSTNFNSLVEKVESDEMIEQKVTLYKILSEMHRKEDRIRRNKNGKFYYESTEVGETLKQVAENITINKDLVEIKTEIFNY